MEMARQDKTDKFSRLVDIITRLRSENGCPWDRKQTAASLKKYLLEECAELTEAIDLEIADHIREETGDLFYILILLTLIHEDQGLFSLNQVLEGISEKMIRRHPHVFAGRRTGNENELRQQWEDIKSNEK
jgi:tetrapyrrole methylase family protein/MazG family protein